MGEQSDSFRGIRVLTAVAGAITVLYPDQAAAWPELSALSFASYPNLPISLWVSQHSFSDEKTGGVGVLTQGLAAFVGRELELVATGLDLKTLLDRAFGLTTYLVQNGSVLKDGSMFGTSETERIAVNLRVSSRLPVYRSSQPRSRESANRPIGP
jgi:hypothetical protein